MDFVGLLKFALKYVIFLAWPLVALVYPLWASIRVIETKSNALMQKLIAYWISFSLILLFEHAFGKLIEWLSFWCYIRLVIIIFLVVHEFAGSLYVYEHIVCPCLSVNVETLIMVVNKAKKPFNKKDTFLTQLEKYVKENGTEALENLIATEIGSHLGNEKNEINRVTEVEQPKLAEPKVEGKDISTVEATDKKEGSSIKPPKLAEPKVESKDISTVEATDKKEGSSIKPISLIEPKLPSAKTNVFVPPNPIGIPIQAEECIGLPNKPFPKSVQAECTCGFCCVTNDKLVGSCFTSSRKETRAAHDELQAERSYVPLTGNHSGAKNTTPEVNKPLKNKDLNNNNANEDSQWWCVICNIKCSAQVNFDSHLNGRKHLAKIKGANKV